MDEQEGAGPFHGTEPAAFKEGSGTGKSFDPQSLSSNVPTRLIVFWQFSGPFQMFTPGGVLIVLPPKYADEIRNDERLSFSAWMEKVSFDGLTREPIGNADICRRTSSSGTLSSRLSTR